MTQRFLVVLTVLVAALLSPFGAFAQSEKTPTLPIERFRAPIDSSGLGTTEGAGIPDHLGFEAALLLQYQLNPLVVRDETTREVVNAIIANRIGGDLAVTVGLFDYVSLGLDLPLLLFQNSGDLGELAGPAGLGGGLAAMGVGDLRLVPKVRVLREDRHLVSLSLLATVTLPTASGLNFTNGFSFDYGGSYLGEGPGSFSIVPELAVSTNLQGVRVAGNLAYRLRPPIVYVTPRGPVNVNPEINYRLGVGYDIGSLSPQVPSVLVYGEVFGATSDRNPFGLLTDASLSPDDKALAEQEVALANALEWAAGVRWHAIAGVHLEAGIGRGILSGFGSPDLRVFAGVRYAPKDDDRDKDGVKDDVDACADEPEDKDGFSDTDGCPDLDNDADGLPDAADACPDEPEDVDGFEDSDGCSEPDNDKDGTLDRDDRCPDDSGPVETQGCPIRDGDKDGVPDDDDKCPEEPGPPERKGCPAVDTDEDGVTDDTDKCPEEPGPAEREGCPLSDRDKDGVEDKDDKCPDAAGPVERQGCPINDKDLDGIEDKQDKCPDKAGPAERKGCPIPDEDGDGIEDKIDACPKEAGPVVLKGCPDTDGDGVADREDKCPDVPGARMFEGCGDKDQDGVGDHIDKCPDEPETINGVKDDDGCPDKGKVVVIVTKEKIEIKETVYFQTGKARIQRRSFNLLNQVAQVLKASPQIKKVRVEGHTDSQGNDAFNKRLSQARAESVADYLAKRGVDRERLEPEGFGEERPVASNGTRSGRAQNRRVEFVIVEQ